MRRRVVLVVSVLLVVASCASETAADVGAEATLLEPTVEEVLPSGRAALAAAAGEPHVLWFWGAH